MSSLIMGRQRRGKLELSTINDISKIVTAEQLYPLGYEITVPGTQIPGSLDGITGAAVLPENLGQVPQTWVYVRNGTAATISAGFSVGGWCAHLSDTSAPATAGPPKKFAAPFVVGYQAGGNATSTNVVGIPQFDIPVGHYGFILRKGVGKALFEDNATTLFAGQILAADPAATDGRCVGVGLGAVTNIEGGFGIILDTFVPIAVPPTNAYLNNVYINCLG